MGMKRQTCDLAKERRRARRKETGFQPDAYRENDAIRGKHKHTDESKALHLQYIELWIEWVASQCFSLIYLFIDFSGFWLKAEE